MPENRRENLISPAAADKLLAAHDGDLALLYLYLCRSGCSDMEQAAGKLCRTLREMEAAEEKLRRMGLLDALPAAPVRPEPVFPREELPQYRAEELYARSREDEQFSVILAEAAKVLGHSLSGSDMKILFGIYDYLALPTEVILELLNYVAELFAEKYGGSRRPSAKALEKEAYVWANEELLTLDRAESYIRSQKQRRGDIGRIRQLLGIHDRDFSLTERKAVSAWLDMGFDEEAIAIAYDRTVVNTGSFKLRYMNRILENWHDSGLHSAAEIEARDGRRSSPAPVSGSSGKTIDRSILDKI